MNGANGYTNKTFEAEGMAMTQPPPPTSNPVVVPPQPGVPGGPAAPIQFMAQPQVIPGIPAGLEYLAQIDQLIIHQQVQIFQLMTGWETNTKFQIKNSMGQQVYFAAEESDVCMRQMCKNKRGFLMHITDNFGKEVILVRREFKCCAGCCWCANVGCCQMEISVEAPVGQVIGYVKQQCSSCAPKYEILDADMQPVLNILGQCCLCQAVCCPADIDFKIFSGEHEIGKISKQYAGFAVELLTAIDNFGVSFPMDLDVRLKAVILGTVFLIDFMYFEQKKERNK